MVQRHTNLEYKIEHLQREEIPEIPEVALRESIINAVCHRDYFQKGSHVMIEVFDNRVEISNPGGIPSELDPADFGKKSVARNPVIASLLHRIDFIERIGTGINRIKNAVTEHWKCSVDFKLTGFFTVIYKRKKLTSGNGGLSDAVQEILREIIEHPGIQAKELAQKLGRSISTLEKQIKQLIEKNIIERRGSKKNGGYWEVVK
jgi:ATP-dependent DNA helicase RecG